MTRGEIFIAAARGAYMGQPRPVVIVRDRFDATASVTVCPLTANPVEAAALRRTRSRPPLTRVAIAPSEVSGLDRPSKLMGDKVMTVPRASLRERLGRLPDNDLVRLNRALIVLLGLAD